MDYFTCPVRLFLHSRPFQTMRRLLMPYSTTINRRVNPMPIKTKNNLYTEKIDRKNLDPIDGHIRGQICKIWLLREMSEKELAEKSGMQSPQHIQKSKLISQRRHEARASRRDYPRRLKLGTPLMTHAVNFATQSRS